jgi:hypothetical protein
LPATLPDRLESPSYNQTKYVVIKRIWKTGEEFFSLRCDESQLSTPVVQNKIRRRFVAVVSFRRDLASPCTGNNYEIWRWNQMLSDPVNFPDGGNHPEPKSLNATCQVAGSFAIVICQKYRKSFHSQDIL